MTGVGDGAEVADELGVLVVHGIGTQKKGSSLVGFVDPLHDLLNRLLAEDGAAPGSPAPVAVTRAFVKSAEDSKAPANVTLELRGHPDGGLTTWCVAESWWAEEFDPPTPRALLSWGVTVAPTTLLLHLARSIRFRWASTFGLGRLGVAAYAAVGAVATALSMIGLTLALLALWLLNLVPLPKVGTYAARAGSVLAATIGDSFVLVDSPVQFAAMASRVDRDLRWLSERCRAVAVVAHSQGAVVATEALSAPNSVRPLLLVTVGAGLSKIRHLLDERRKIERFAGWIGMVALLCAGYGLLNPDAAPARVALITTLVVLGFCVRMAVQLSGDEEAALREQLTRQLRPGAELTWTDIVASADPVPGGPLFLDDPGWVTQYPVTNKASSVGDHTSYYTNIEAVVPRIVDDLLRMPAAERSRIVLQRHLDPAVVAAATARRRVRFRWLRRAQRATVLILLVLAWLRLDDLLAVPDRLRLPWRLEGSIATLVGGVQFVWDAAHLHRPVAGALLIVLAVVLASRGVLALAWRPWAAQDLRRLVRPADPTAARDGAALAATAGLGLPLLLTAVAIATGPFAVGLTSALATMWWGCVVALVTFIAPPAWNTGWAVMLMAVTAAAVVTLLASLVVGVTSSMLTFFGLLLGVPALTSVVVMLTATILRRRISGAHPYPASRG